MFVYLEKLSAKIVRGRKVYGRYKYNDRGFNSKENYLFAIPLFLGNLFQQLYNTADSLIVGNFLGSSALAAVASSGNLIFLLVGFFNGLSVGAGVVIATFFWCA